MQIFKFAIDMEIATTNFAALVELPAREDSDIRKFFTAEELSTLWQHTDDLGARVAFILCYTGLRPTELAKIKIADIDLTARFMRGGIKTAAGKNRLIPIAEKIFPLIEVLTVAGTNNTAVTFSDDSPLRYNRESKI